MLEPESPSTLVSLRSGIDYYQYKGQVGSILCYAPSNPHPLPCLGHSGYQYIMRSIVWVSCFHHHHDSQTIYPGLVPPAIRQNQS